MVYVVALIVDALAPSFGGTEGPGAGTEDGRLLLHGIVDRRHRGDPAVHRSAHHARGGHLRHLSAVPRPAAHDEVSAGQGGWLHGGDHHRRDRAELPHRRGRRARSPARACSCAAARRSAPRTTRATTTFDKDSTVGKLEQYAKQVEDASKKMEAAQKSGDQDAQAEAMKTMMGAALGGGDVEALAPDRLKPFLPESLGGLHARDVLHRAQQRDGHADDRGASDVHERRRPFVGLADHRHGHREGPAGARRLGRRRRRERNRQPATRRRTTRTVG